MWEAVQLEIEKGEKPSQKNNIGKFDYATKKSFCSCGGVYGRKMWNSTDERLKRAVCSVIRSIQ